VQAIADESLGQGLLNLEIPIFYGGVVTSGSCSIKKAKSGGGPDKGRGGGGFNATVAWWVLSIDWLG